MVLTHVNIAQEYEKYGFQIIIYKKTYYFTIV